jgi:hypothetical protein
MDPRDYYEIPLCKVLYFVRGTGTTGGIKQMAAHNCSENCRGARVALCAHPTRTDKNTNNFFLSENFNGFQSKSFRNEFWKLTLRFMLQEKVFIAAQFQPISTDIMRFEVLTAASMKFRFVFWDVLPCKIIVDRRFRGTCCLHHQGDGGEWGCLKTGRWRKYLDVRGMKWLEDE